MIAFPSSLLSGYRAFRGGRYARDRARYRTLAEHGQTPETMVIACCDSRVAPEAIFNALPGEIFVVRNIANLVPPYEPDGPGDSTAAALEYAVQSLKVKHIVVLGHARCGGIRAALSPSEPPLSPGNFVGNWMAPLRSVADPIAANHRLTDAERQTALERASIRGSIANLRTFPCVAVLEGRDRLELHGAWFDISDGGLWTLNPATGDFVQAE